MLPTSFKNQLSLIGAQFGGFEEISKVLPPEQIYYLATFPGSFFVVTPWSFNTEGYKVDFSFAGHLPNAMYSVYNREFTFLYSANGTIFEGVAASDLLEKAYNGEYFHVELQTENGRQLVILWVCKKLAPIVVQNVIANIKREIQPRTVKSHELFIDCRNVSVVIYYAYGENMTAESIKLSGRSITASNKIIRLTPTKPTWYGFEINNAWYKVGLSGEEEARWIEKDNLYFFNSINSYIPNTKTLTTRNFKLPKMGYARLFGKPTERAQCFGPKNVVVYDYNNICTTMPIVLL